MVVPNIENKDAVLFSTVIVVIIACDIVTPAQLKTRLKKTPTPAQSQSKDPS